MMEKPHKTPDVRQLVDGDLPEAAFPAVRSDFRVYFDAETHARIVQHAGEDKSVEICGVLVGRWEQDANGPFVTVSEFIRCDEAAKKSGEVTFTHDAWSTINREMDTRFVDLKIVGWYHSHPGYGVFLSERDVFIHEHFFSNPGQVALVVDPLQKTEGVFVWRDGKPKPCSHFWVGERICAAAEGQRSEEAGPKNRAGAAKPPDPQRPGDFSFMAILSWALPLAAVFLIGYLLADMKTSWEQRRLIEGTVAHFGTWKCLRPGLRENLDKVADNVRMIQAVVGELADRHVKASGEEAADLKADWGEVLKALRVTRKNLYDLASVYGLDPAEEDALKALLADKLTELGAPPKEKADSKEKTTPKEKPAAKEKPAPKPPATKEK